MKNHVNFLICDDDPMILSSLQEQLEAGITRFGAEVQVAACGNATAAIQTARTFEPDVILMDLYMFGDHFAGVRALQTLVPEHPHARCIALTAHGANIPDSDFRELYACNLDGYIDKSRGVGGVLNTCYQIYEGNRWFEPDYLSRVQVLKESSELAPEPLPTVLSEREREILRLFAKDFSPKLIASLLDLRQPTVYSYLNRAQSKLGLGSRQDLRAYCLRHGLHL